MTVSTAAHVVIRIKGTISNNTPLLIDKTRPTCRRTSKFVYNRLVVVFQLVSCYTAMEVNSTSYHLVIKITAVLLDYLQDEISLQSMQLFALRQNLSQIYTRTQRRSEVAMMH